MNGCMDGWGGLRDGRIYLLLHHFFPVFDFFCRSRGKRGGLYDLCNPCYTKIEDIIQPDVNIVLAYDQASCNQAKCIRFPGNQPMGRCVPFDYELPIPIPNANCNGVDYRTIKLRVGCVCKSYIPF